MGKGDLYPIGIQYCYDGTTGDLVYNEHQDDAGKLQMAYMFTQGIENGYISIPTNEISLNNYNIKNLVPPAPGKAAGSMSELLSLHSEQYTVDTENT